MISSWWSDSPNPDKVSSPEIERSQNWQLQNGWDAQDVSRLLAGKGLLAPLMDVQKDGQLLPDYKASIKLYQSIQDAGLHLVAGEESLRWHYKVLTAVEQNCPPGATKPLPSCEAKSWYAWLPGMEDDSGNKLLVRYLRSIKADYVIIPDERIYLSEARYNLKYAPSSEPLVSRSLHERLQSLAPLQEQMSLTVVRRPAKSKELIFDKTWQVARCAVDMPKAVNNLSDLAEQRESLLQRLQMKCVESLAGLKDFSEPR
ncbi:hypothetical protein [Parendozoicomonas haliclonae]|uniref:Uncharacterized protein n=1 Tax=Parendozoicomonas haliclonae TaxID=1960125 RepID=A0A1X7AJS7_9GAMM|nr:hypothetical protein [Parendozoicomonas haliclonae]SMA42204.1 hypothetical protein EHSB41UT_01403 [Parendozoicomonas haliclonae]